MKKVMTTLLSLLLLGSTVFAERIPVEGWFKTTGAKGVRSGETLE